MSDVHVEPGKHMERGKKEHAVRDLTENNQNKEKQIQPLYIFFTSFLKRQQELWITKYFK